MKQILSLAVFISFFLGLSAQAPEQMNYQAVARNAAGNALPNQNISLRFTIHDGSSTGSVVYQETAASATNQFGLFTAAVGGGTPVSGTFNDVFWGGGYKYLQVEMDAAGGTNFADMGVSQLLSVPYALYAKNTNDWGHSGLDMFNLNGGNIGIGTTLPSALLHVVSLNDTALYAETLSSSALAPAIQGYSNSAGNINQIGLLGSYYAMGASYGAGVAGIGYSGTMPPANTDIGVYGSAGGGGLAVYAKGRVRIEDGTQGNLKVLTSDASGTASWTNAKALQDTVNPAGRTFFKVYKPVAVTPAAGAQKIWGTDASGNVNYLDSLINFTITDADNAGVYNTAYSYYKIPEDGYYHFEAKLDYWFYEADPYEWLGHGFSKNGAAVSFDYNMYNGDSHGGSSAQNVTSIYTGYFQKNDKVSVYARIGLSGAIQHEAYIWSNSPQSTYFSGWKLF